jgi:hypothetical protein
MQPPFFSIGDLQDGQLWTFSLRRNAAFIASSAFCCFVNARHERPACAVPCSKQYTRSQPLQATELENAPFREIVAQTGQAAVFGSSASARSSVNRARSSSSPLSRKRESTPGASAGRGHSGQWKASTLTSWLSTLPLM